MDAKTIVSMLLPIGLGVLNFGIGLGLKWSDFKRIKDHPKPVGIGMAVQILLLPLIAYALNFIFKMPPLLAIGLLLLASSPGGAIANFYSHLAKGDVALNVTLSAINAIWGVFFVPFMVAVSYKIYALQGASIPMQFDKLVQLMIILLLPLIAGIYVNENKPDWTTKNIKKINRFGVIYLVVLVILAIVKDYAIISDAILRVGHVVVLFNLISMFLGYLVAKAFLLNKPQQIAITMEVGIHHCSIILAIALSPDLLNSIEVAMPSAVYIFLMHITAGTLVYFLNRLNKQS